MRLRFKYTYKTDLAISSRDTTRSRDVTFPDLTFEWGGLEKFPVLSWVASRSDIQSSYALKVDREVEGD